MNEETYKEQNITAYLLGLLPNDEAEQMDEFSITDDDFSNKLRSVENDLVDSYVKAEMETSMREQFESHYLASPLRRKKIEFARTFRNFAEKEPLVETVAETSDAESRGKGFISRLFAGSLFSRPVLQFSFAAAALLLVGIGGWWIIQKNNDGSMAGQSGTQQNGLQPPSAINGTNVDNSKDEQQIAQSTQPEQNANAAPRPVKTPESPQPKSPVIASFILTPQLRSGSQIKTVSIPKQADTASITLQLEAADFAKYNAVLREQSSGKILWRANKLRPRAAVGGKVLNISFPASLLKSQIYSIVLLGASTPDKPEESISDYTFRIVR